MNETIDPMKKTTLTFGLLSGLIIIAYSVVVFLWMGEDITVEKFAVAEMLGFLRYVILLLAIFFTLWTMRKRSEGGISFGRLFKEGFFVAVIAALFVGAMEAIYLSVYPGFMEQAQSIYIERMVADGATATELAEMKGQMEAFAWMQKPALSGLFYFFETLLVGTVGAVLMGLFLKRKA